jgi:hypothetical protein
MGPDDFGHVVACDDLPRIYDAMGVAASGSSITEIFVETFVSIACRDL